MGSLLEVGTVLAIGSKRGAVWAICGRRGGCGTDMAAGLAGLVEGLARGVGSFGVVSSFLVLFSAAARTATVRPQGLRSVPLLKLRLKVPPAHESKCDWTLFY